MLSLDNLPTQRLYLKKNSTATISLENIFGNLEVCNSDQQTFLYSLEVVSREFLKRAQFGSSLGDKYGVHLRFTEDNQDYLINVCLKGEINFPEVIGLIRLSMSVKKILIFADKTFTIGRILRLL